MPPNAPRDCDPGQELLIEGIVPDLIESVI